MQSRGEYKLPLDCALKMCYNRIDGEVVMVMGFTFDNIDSDSLGIIVKMYQHITFPEIRSRLVEVPGHDGAYDFGTEFGSRKIEIPCAIKGDDRADLVNKIQNIARTFNPRNGLKRLTFDEHPDRYYLARLSEPVPVEQIYNVGQFSLVFILPDPFAFTDGEVSASIPVGGLLDLTINTPGDLRTRPRFEIWGATTAIQFRNLTFGTSFSYSSGLTPTDYLVVDTIRNTVILNNSVNALPNIVGNFWNLEIGENRLQIATTLPQGAQPQVRITWVDKYM